MPNEFAHFLNGIVRQHCVTSPWILVCLVTFDLIIAYVYWAIPRSLRRILRAAGGDLVTGAAEIRSFAAFIQACSGSHFFGAAVLFFPALDWPRVGWLAWTALVSWRTLRLLRRSEDLVISSLLDRRRLEARLNNGSS